MPQATPMFASFAILCEIKAAQKFAHRTGLLASIRIVTAGASSPNLIFTDEDDNQFYEIDATNLVDNQIIYQCLRDLATD
jgi:hypothetical protein